MSLKKTKGFIILTTIFRQEDDVWTAECKELGTATFGDTLEEAKTNLDDAIIAHLNTLEDVGECERFLRERGIKFHHTDKPKKITLKDIPFDPDIFVTQNIKRIPIEAAC